MVQEIKLRATVEPLGNDGGWSVSVEFPDRTGIGKAERKNLGAAFTDALLMALSDGPASGESALVC